MKLIITSQISLIANLAIERRDLDCHIQISYEQGRLDRYLLTLWQLVIVHFGVIRQLTQLQDVCDLISDASYSPLSSVKWGNMHVLATY